MTIPRAYRPEAAQVMVSPRARHAFEEKLTEGPLGLNISLNSFVEDGGIYRSTTARFTVEGGTIGRGVRGKADRSS